MIETERILLRNWKESDIPTWVEMNSDPEVMRYLPKILNPEEARAMAARLSAFIDENGFGLWAVELKESADFLGFVGLSRQNVGNDLGDFIEIGWRMKRSAWGQGFATEAALAALEFGRKRFDQIYSVTAKTNLASQRVMQKIGLRYRPELDFDHPRIENFELRPHLIYSD